MSSIHPTEYGTYELKWRENGHPKSKTRKTKALALELKREVDQRLLEGKPVMRRSDVPTLQAFTARWLAGRSDLAESTQIRYAEQLNTHVLPFLGHLPLVDLRPKRLGEWQRQRLEEGAGRAVLGKAQALLAQILEEAVLPYEYLDQNPALALRRPAYKKRPHRWLTAGEVEALRGYYIEREDIGSATLVSVLGYVGIRPQDALARVWPDLDKRLAVETKNSDGTIQQGSKSREEHRGSVYVPALVRADFEQWRLASDGAGLMWSRPSDGLPWTKTDWDNWCSRHPKGKKNKRPKCFKAAAEAVGLGASLTPYDLRHTAATLYAAAGWNHVKIANQLRHSPNVSATIYQHLLDEEDDEAPKRSVDDYIREARGIAPEPVKDSFGVEAR